MAQRLLDDPLPDANAEAKIRSEVNEDSPFSTLWIRDLRRKWWYDNDPEFRAECIAEQIEKDIDDTRRRSDKNWNAFKGRTENLPRRHMREVGRIARDQWSPVHNELARIWTGKESVMLVGPEGSGKTTAMVWAAEWCAVRGVWVQYTTATMFAAHAKNEESLSELKKTGLLIIDEIHRFDAIPDWIASALIGVIDYRYYQEKPMLSAGTLPPDKIADVVGKEIVKRFDHRIATNAKSFRV